MGRAPRYHDDIERLLSYGYNAKDVAEELNLGIATVYRVLGKLKTQARYDFKNLMEEDYLWKYQKTLENFDRTIRECNEEIFTMKVKYEELEGKANLQMNGLTDNRAITKAAILQSLINIRSNRSNEMTKLTAQRDKATDMKAKVYNAGPVVNAIDQWVHQTTPSAGELPKIAELDKVEPLGLPETALMRESSKPIIKPMLKAEGEIIPNINDSVDIKKDIDNAQPNINVQKDETVPSWLNNSDSKINKEEDNGKDEEIY